MAQGMIITASALMRGATLCAFDVRREGLTALADWLVDERISVYVSVSSLFRSFARTLDPHDGFRRPFGTNRGRARHAGRCRRPSAAFHPRATPGAYAATEAGPIALHEVGAAETFPEGVVPVGRTLAGVTVFVRDEAGRQMPDAESGELVVRSAYLSPGYWGQPEQTAQAFLTSSAAALTGERDYPTGDLGRIRNGRIEHLGRVGHRIQIGGVRIELEGVEAALHACPDVLRAAALAKPRVTTPCRSLCTSSRSTGARPRSTRCGPPWGCVCRNR